MSIKLRHELAKPCGAIRPNRKNLSVTVFCHENKSVVIVEKLGVNPPTTEVMGFPPLLWVAAF